MRPPCTISYHRKFVDDPTEVFERLRAELPLQIYTVKIFGKEVVQPREVSWHGPGEYAYSGLMLQPEPWHEDLLAIREKLKEETKLDFNSVLVNHYRDENDSVGWHADDETYMEHSTIATVSLGAPRLFCMKPKGGGKTDRHLLENGSLFIMGAGVQDDWLHSVPKSKVSTGPRISLTYRIWKAP